MNSDNHQHPFVLRHILFGWCCLLGFILVGLVLDYFHAFHVGWYMDANHETRRLMGTLAHAHGTLLGGLNIAYAATLFIVGERGARYGEIASTSLLSASIIMPLGFLLAGVFLLEDQPGIAVFLVPVGGFFLVISVAATVVSLWSTPRNTPPKTKPKSTRRKK